MDEVAPFRALARSAPRLEREEELVLTRLVREHNDTVAADKLARSHLRTVVAIALRYRRYGLPFAELISEGSFGLVHALGKFQPELGNRFSTYASYWIRAYMLEHIIRSFSMVGGGSGALRSKLFFKLRRERARTRALFGEGEAADHALATRIGIPAEQLAIMLGRLETRDLSIDARVSSDSAFSIADTLCAPDDQEEALSDSRWLAQQRSAIRVAVTELDPRERYVIENSLLAEQDDELSLAQIGRNLGVSRERARQLQTRAKRKLSRRIAALSRVPPQVRSVAA
jgi:RNA polymerase sigma-32 factor